VSRRRTALLATLVVLASLTPAAWAGRSAPRDRTARYDVTVRTTEYGIPHIQAKDWGSLGYGYGYELAGNAICVMADTYTTVRAQRSRFFGADNGYVFRGNDSSVNNLTSDFFFAQINADHRVEKLMAATGPTAVHPQVFQLAQGYVAGYNRWLSDHGGAAGVTDPACKGKPWVTPITEIDDTAST